MAVVQEVGEEAGAARGPHLARRHRTQHRRHHAARGAGGAVELHAALRVVVRHAENVAWGGTGSEGGRPGVFGAPYWGLWVPEVGSDCRVP